MSAIFSRILSVILAIIAVFTGGRMDNVSIEVTNEVTTQSETIVYEVSNYTGKTITMDEYFTLEVNKDGEWVEVPQIDEVHDISLSLGNIRTFTRTISIPDAFGTTLEAGEYRLTKGYSGEYSCSAVFNVIEA